MAERHQARLVRYADDFVVVCRKQTEAPMRMIRRLMGKMGLSLNEEKTRVVNYRNCGKAMSEVKAHAEQRLRIWLRNRHRVRPWKEGYQRSPTASLYADYGLYKVPTTAGWTAKVHAL